MQKESVPFFAFHELMLLAVMTMPLIQMALVLIEMGLLLVKAMLSMEVCVMVVRLEQ